MNGVIDLVSEPVLQLHLVGVVLIGLAALHVIFPRYFEWRTQLASLSLINRQLMGVHTFFVAFAVLLMGGLCAVDADDLVNTRLGRHVALGFAVFWGARWFVQHFVYSSDLWRGKRFETVVHVLFSMLWGWVTIVFGWVAFR